MPTTCLESQLTRRDVSRAPYATSTRLPVSLCAISATQAAVLVTSHTFYVTTPCFIAPDYLAGIAKERSSGAKERGQEMKREVALAGLLLYVAKQGGDTTMKGSHATKEGVGFTPTPVPLMIPLVVVMKSASFVARRGVLDMVAPWFRGSRGAWKRKL